MKRFRVLIAALSFLLTVPVQAQYALQFGAAVASDGEAVYAGEGRNLLQNGSVFVYGMDDDGTWQMTNQIQASDPIESGNGFGRSIALAGDVMVVGAPLVGAVYVFERGDDGVWRCFDRAAHR